MSEPTPETALTDAEVQEQAAKVQDEQPEAQEEQPTDAADAPEAAAAKARTTRKTETVNLGDQGGAEAEKNGNV